MKIDKKSFILSAITVLICVLIIVPIVKAGTLTPPGSAFSGGGDVPTTTMYTLQDIYNKLTGATVTPHTTLNPASGPTTGTMDTLTQIYNAIPATVLWQTDQNVNLCWSTGQSDSADPSGDPTDIGGEEENCTINGGLADDSGLGFVDGVDTASFQGSWSSGSYTQYQEVEDSSYNYWICMASGGCSDTPATDTDWTQIYPIGAMEYCQHLDYDGISVHPTPDTEDGGQPYWHLPTIMELMNEMNNEYTPGGTIFSEPGNQGNQPPGGFQSNYGYWASTPFANDPGNAWSAGGNDGGVYSYGYGENYPFLVRCAH